MRIGYKFGENNAEIIGCVHKHSRIIIIMTKITERNKIIIINVKYYTDNEYKRRNMAS